MPQFLRRRTQLLLGSAHRKAIGRNTLSPWGVVTSYPFAVLVEKEASSSQGLADPGPSTSLGSMGTWDFLPQLSLISRLTDEWAPAWPRAGLSQEGFDFCDSSFIGINVRLLPRSTWGSPSGGPAQISGAKTQPGALRKGPGLLRVWGWWPIGGAGSPSTAMSLDKAFGLSCAAGGRLRPLCHGPPGVLPAVTRHW